MHVIDMLFWFALALGSVYVVTTFLLGTVAHGMHHGSADIHGAHGHAGHIDSVGHADTAGHAHTVGHADTAGHAHTAGHADAAHHGAHDGQPGNHDTQTDSSSGDDVEQPRSLPIHINVMKYLSPLSLASFLTGFGWTGVICRMLGKSELVSLLCAIAAGWCLWFCLYSMVAKMFATAGGTSHYRSEDVVGLKGQVVTGIDGVRPGVVTYIVSGTRQSIRAIADDGDMISAGTEVRIRKIENQTAHVVRVNLPQIGEGE